MRVSRRYGFIESTEEDEWSFATLLRNVGAYFINLLWLTLAALIGAYLGEIIVIIAGVWQRDWVVPAVIVGTTGLVYLLILGAARMNNIVLAIVCTLVSISYFVAQCLYAYSESSTAAIVYIYFYFVGTPVALLWVIISWSYNFTRSSPDN